MTETVLILGATGRFGRNAAEEFGSRGWTVRGFNRKTDDLMRAARGADVIVNAWNPPYPDWTAEVPGLHARAIAAAKASGATVIVPGNVYVFGKDTPPPWGAHSAHDADNRLGRVRIAMERAYAQSGVPTILLRAGDFIDTRASGNWFDKVMTKKLGKGVLTYPGRPDIDHAWAFLPDVVRAAADLAERRADLPGFVDIPFPGYTLSGQQMAAALERAIGAPVRVEPMAWWPLALAGPVWPLARCLREMRYLWDTPHRLDGAGMDRWLPGFRPTPLDAALRLAVGVTSPDRARPADDGLPA
jgi:uncharacterized protein YbjT (DUF2867 family)